MVLKVRNCFQWKVRKAGKEVDQHRSGWAVLPAGCGAEQTSHHGFILVFYPPAVPGSALVGHETWLNIYPPTSRLRNPGGCGQGLQESREQCRSEQCPLLFAMDLKENISYVLLHCLVSSSHPRRGLKVSAILLGLVLAVPHCCCAPVCGVYGHLASPAWHSAANASLATYILLLHPSKSFRIIFKTCHFPPFF